MSLKKKELIVSVILLGVLLITGLSSSVLATSNWMVQGENKIPQTTNNIPSTSTNNTTNTTPNTTNNNATGQLANTGLESMPWVIIGICVISAMFAYKKVKEYKNI